MDKMLKAHDNKIRDIENRMVFLKGSGGSGKLHNSA